MSISSSLARVSCRLAFGGFAVAAIASFAFLNGAAAEFSPVVSATQELKIGFADIKEITARSKAVTAIIAPAEAALIAKQEDLEKKMFDYREAKQALESRRSVLTAEDFAKQESAVQAMLGELAELDAKIEDELKKLEATSNDVIDRVLDAVKRYGQSRQFDYVLPSDVILYAAQAHDLTALLIEEIDRSGLPRASAIIPRRTPPPSAH